MPNPCTITLTQLTEKHACREQRELFKQTFGESVKLSEELVIKFASQFSINWCAENLLTSENNFLYEKQIAPLLAEYEKQHAPLLAEYEKQIAPLLAEYEKQRAPRYAEYQKQIAQLLAEYEKQRAIIFYTLYKDQP